MTDLALKEKLVFESEETEAVAKLEKLNAELRRASGKEKRVYWTAKRCIDIVFSFVALLVLSPLFLGLAAVIFIDDPHGSPFYSQNRVGRHGKIFKFWKFRSMVTNADKMVKDLQHLNEKDGPVFKIENDPRITKIGHFIRKTSLDELPQLWNVLKGDMSLVGPRPALPAEVLQYNDYQNQRLLVTPGLTCYWQVKSNRDSIGFDEWMDLDIKYIQERSVWTDIKLVLQTVKVVLTGQGQ